MIVRNEQMAAMQDAANEASERKLARQLSALTPAPQEELTAFVHSALARARRNGISAESELAEFCTLVFRIAGPSSAPNEPKWLRRIMTDPKLDGAAKLAQIRARAGGAA